mgnify:CR=1 FL=1
MNDQESGAATENRFLHLMSTKVSYTPGWYLQTAKAESEWDHRGIDFFVYIAHKKGGDPVKVPVQIKSSENGARKFRRTHSSHRTGNILLFVVTPQKTDKDVRRMVYACLSRVRESGKRYDGYYAQELAKAEAHWKSRT